jgi:predicted DCC family thiol-disulfide oxidoreductase YuxK
MNEKIILFDGVCNLCNGFVNFVIKRDPGMKFRFAALQSAAGKALLERHRLNAESLETVVLIDGTQVYQRSSAALKIIKQLGALWPLLYVFIILPAPWRDWLYDIIAKRRYRWYGKRDQCRLPSPQEKNRFL